MYLTAWGLYRGAVVFFLAVPILVIAIIGYGEAHRPNPNSSFTRDSNTISIVLIVCGVLTLLMAIVMIAHLALLAVSLAALPFVSSQLDFAVVYFSSSNKFRLDLWVPLWPSSLALYPLTWEFKSRDMPNQ